MKAMSNVRRTAVLILLGTAAVGCGRAREKRSDDAGAGMTESTSADPTVSKRFAASCLAIETAGMCLEYSDARSRFEDTCRSIHRGTYAAPGTRCPTVGQLAKCVRTDDDGFAETRFYVGTPYTTLNGRTDNWSLAKIRSECKASTALFDKGNKYDLTEFPPPTSSAAAAPAASASPPSARASPTKKR